MDCVRHHAVVPERRFPDFFAEYARTSELAPGRLVFAGGYPTVISGAFVRFPEIEAAVARDSVRARCLLGRKAEHLSLRDHSASKSARRTTPIR